LSGGYPKNFPLQKNAKGRAMKGKLEEKKYPLSGCSHLSAHGIRFLRKSGLVVSE